MPTRITRVGNALTVEIPEDLAQRASLSAGETVEWVPNGDHSIALVKKAEASRAEPRKRITLEDLLEGSPKTPKWKKLTGVHRAESNFGKPVRPRCGRCYLARLRSSGRSRASWPEAGIGTVFLAIQPARFFSVRLP